MGKLVLDYKEKTTPLYGEELELKTILLMSGSPIRKRNR